MYVCHFVLFILAMIVLSVLRFTASDYIFLFWLWLYCLSYDLRHLITSFYFGYCIVCLKIYSSWLHLFILAMIVLSVLRFTHLITSFYFGYCIVCLTIYGIWLHLFILAMIVLSVLRFTASDYIFLIWLWLYCLSYDLRHLITSFLFWLLYCLSYDLRHLITSFYFGYDCIVCLKIYGIWLHLFIMAIVLSVLRFTASDYIFLFWLWLYCLS